MDAGKFMSGDMIRVAETDYQEVGQTSNEKLVIYICQPSVVFDDARL
jgi:hypothetical protein